MIIVAEYSFNNGKEYIVKNHPKEIEEIKKVIKNVDGKKCKKKISKEKTMKGKILYSPICFNKEFKKLLQEKGWNPLRIDVKTYIPEIGKEHKGFREMDAVKNKVGVEVQFGKYAFMVYNVAAKMTIFNKLGYIDCGVEIVPMLSLAGEMSTGVSYFEQMKTDLEYRGVSNIDIPVLVIGIDVEKRL